MKSFILALALTTSSVFAAEILIDSRVQNTNEAVTGEFKVNEEMGRAWVELEIAEQGFTSATESMTPSYERVHVPGLSLQGNTVVLDVDGARVVCAVVRNVGIFHTRVARMTGDCGFSSYVVKETQDDGYETSRVRVIKTSIVTY